MITPITLIVADDHAMVRLGLEQAISRQSDLKLLSMHGSGREALEAYKEQNPDVILLDFRMPGGDGVEVTEAICSFDPDAAILIHSAYGGEESVWSAVNAGARGYVSKNSDVTVTLDAVRKVAEGGTFFPEDVREKIQSRSARKPLSKREQEVLELLSEGMSNKEIMVALSVSSSTVRHHVSNVLAKLEAFDRTHAVVKAARRGLIFFD